MGDVRSADAGAAHSGALAVSRLMGTVTFTHRGGRIGQGVPESHCPLGTVP